MRCGPCIFLLTFGCAAFAREPWLSSRIVGSPDPPAPYITERVFPKLKFREPVEMTPIPGTDRLIMVEREAKIFSFPNKADCEKADLFVSMKDLSPEIYETYSMAFHPGFLTNRYVFIFYILKSGLPDGTHISRFKVRDTDPPTVDLSTEKLIITWLSGGHNGGCIRFGPDGYMYLAAGDATVPSPPDLLDTGQDLSDLLGSILRIDIDREDPGKPYRIPPDNPFINTPRARPEIWAYGFRNPWRMSFDPATGNLWVGDVGWELWEMIYRIERGGNYGWSLMEGTHVVRPGSKKGPTPILPPVVEHSHSEAASITGGYVYRGKRLSELKGAYIYGDYETGKIWEWRNGRSQEIADTPFKIISFAEDHEGELYILDYAGTAHRLARNPAAGKPTKFPRKLSETGLFASVRDHQLAPGVAPFSVNADLWSDNAVAERMLGLLGDSTMIKTNENQWAFPSNAVLAKTYTLEQRRIETQLLHFNGEAWGAYTYRWNDEQTDAALVPAAGEEARIGKQTWRFFSRAECLRCHNSWNHVTLGFTSIQLRESMPEHGAVLPKRRKKLVNPYDSSADLDARARSWLHVNCSHCHRENAGGSVVSFMNYELPIEKCRLVDTKPTQGDFGISDARVIAPADPFRSILLYRISKLGTGKMPYLGANIADETGLKLIREWIAAMPGETNTIRTISPVSAALKISHSLPNMSPDGQRAALVGARNSTDPLIRDLFERFLPEEERRKVLGNQIEPQTILSLKGDVTRGRRIFHQEGGAQCTTCHPIYNIGREFGPDLAQIGRKYDRAQLLDHILNPSKMIDPRFAAVLVETSDDLFSGFITRRTEKEVALRIATGEEKVFSSAEVKRLGPQQLSLMPEGLLQGLTAQEAADLLAFLQSLR